MSRNLHVVVALLLALAPSACSRQQSQTSEGPYADSGYIVGDPRAAPGDPRVATDGLTAEQTRPHETPAGSGRSAQWARHTREKIRLRRPAGAESREACDPEGDRHP